MVAPHAPLDAGRPNVPTPQLRLGRLLAGAVSREPGRMAFSSPPADMITAWSRHGLTTTAAYAQVRRLAAFLQHLPLERGGPLGILLPNGAEACVTILAALRAGYAPCLLSLGWGSDELGAAVQAAKVPAIITLDRLGEVRPADLACSIAADNVALRFICSFGHEIPDGVISLDQALNDQVLKDFEELGDIGGPPPSPGLITFERYGDSFLPLLRPESTLIAATLPLVLAARLGSESRVVSLLPPDDLGGLASGLVAALAADCPLTMQALFDGDELVRDLSADPPATLVAPGWIEDLLAEAGLLDNDQLTCVLVHKAPVELPLGKARAARVVDMLTVGEVALMAAARDARGPTLKLGAFGALAPGGIPLLEVDVGRDGAIMARGAATGSIPLVDDSLPPAPDRPENDWHHLPYKAILSEDLIAAVLPSP
ncbi:MULTISPECIES: AMP-binding protein [unclassified Chelatococcus]|uniref:AMP-binding protein n=1 Tax=unclassified Chelatococcus TaxID=2638111 RepID=UPI001BCDFDF0|nr:MULTISPECIES: AMP-binding protein [unclassified Chelatococcus]MBS7695664.1 AMP-binding protein [Chelatococcus sp. YT9]MBX3557943.1 AMP-binding protein [Chelatococcus sp.]